MAKKTVAKAKKVPAKNAAPAKKSVRGQEGQGDEVRLFLRRRQGRRRPHDEGPARRQGLRPRRDDERRPAGPARLHDHDGRLQPLLRARAQGAGRSRDADGSEPREAREGRRPEVRVHRQPAARVRALGRQVLDAGHDGHDPQPRPERRGGRRAEGPHGQRPVRLRQLPPVHADVRQRRARDSQGGVREGVRRRQAREGREARHGARRAGAARGREALQGRRQAQDGQGVPERADGAVARRT